MTSNGGKAQYDDEMDENVIAAMARWPDVPDVFGWLSLSAAGHWRLHPDGSAAIRHSVDATLLEPINLGELIGSSRINQFINQNYAQDKQGRWYFQNGPQRVYVRLDLAPFVLHTIDDQKDGPAFVTHNGLRTRHVTRWCLDELGHLYADTDLGAGVVAGRDLEQVLNMLTTSDGDSLLLTLSDSLPDGSAAPTQVCWRDGSVVAFSRSHFDRVPELLGFVRYPQP